MSSMLDTLWPQTRARIPAFMTALAISSVCQGALFLSIISIIHAYQANTEVFQYLLMFTILLIGTIWGKSLTTRISFGIVTSIVEEYRVRVCSAMLAIPLVRFEQLDFAEIRRSTIDAPQLVTEGSALLERVIHVFGVQVVMILVTVFYQPVFLYFAIPYVTSIGLFFFVVSLIIVRREAKQQRLADQLETGLCDLVDGFKEAKLDDRIREPLVNETLSRLIEQSADGRKKTAMIVSQVYMGAEMLLFLSVGVFAILLPTYMPEDQLTLDRAVLMALFLPVSLFAEIGNFARIFNTLRRMAEIVRGLEGFQHDDRHWLDDKVLDRRFSVLDRGLHVSKLEFEYPSKDGIPGFAVGPVSFDVPAGSITFLTGGNGSGKSTILKALMGLYPRKAGLVDIDGVKLLDEQDQGYFSAIFTDSHLFKEFYGYREIEGDRVNGLLARFGLADKVQFAHGRLSTTALSTGQRKRVALALAMVEDRPVWALDEWAADQDPEFRQWFYTELLPAERAKGRTIIAVTHDDRYFHLADQILKFEYGKIV